MNVGMCSQPWFEMQIQYDFQVRPCCYFAQNMYAWDFSCPIDVRTLWNSEPMMGVRSIIACNLSKGTPCSNCQFMRYAPGPSFLTIDEEANMLQRSNWEAAIRNYEARSLIVDSTPVKFYFNFGLACNLDCIMCCQMDLRESDNRIVPSERLLELKEYLVRANEIVVIGGEPLVIRQAQIFIDTLANDPDYANVKLTLLTNATLLDRFMPLLRKIRRLKLMVSLDSIGAAYEQIRQGAQWETTSANILGFKHESLSRNGLWDIGISGIIMKASVPKLPEFVQWCTGNEIPLWFGPVVEFPFTESENIFKHPELLAEIPEWERRFDDAIALLDEKGWIENGSAPLRLMKDQLSAACLEKFGSGPQAGIVCSGADRISLTTSEPLVSIVIYVKNGMPYVRHAVASALTQTYRNIELIIQAGCSSDGSMEYLKQLVELPNVRIESVHDDGRGLAYNKALSRLNGSIACFLEVDSLLDKDAIATVVQAAASHADCAAIYGDAKILSHDNAILGVRSSPVLDLTGILECDGVPPSVASFFLRQQSGEDWWIDGRCNACCDYEFWLRIAGRPIVRIDKILGSIRLINAVHGDIGAIYSRVCEEKLNVIESYLKRLAEGPAKSWLRRRAHAGAYTWAAEELSMRSVHWSEVQRFVGLARELDPGSVRLIRLNERIVARDS